MFTTDLVAFLEELSDNNNKQWFDANRKRYESLRTRFVELTGEILALTITADLELAGVDPAKCVFRINRDVRFSADKSPYKTTFSAVLTPSKNGGPQGYYYCIDAEGTLEIGVGVHMPDSPTLLRIRKAIASDGAAFDAILHQPRVRQAFTGLEGEQLKTAPRDFPADHPYIHYLRYKSYTIGCEELAAEIPDNALAAHVADRFAAAAPFVKFLRCAATGG